MTTTQTADTLFAQLLAAAGRIPPGVNSPASAAVVCVQGLGFVGSAMSLAVASARDADALPRFRVIGVDLPTADGLTRIDAVNAGAFPFETTDPKLVTAMAAAYDTGNLVATSDEAAYEFADVVIVDVNCDVVNEDGQPRVLLESFVAAIQALARRIRPGTLVIVETTVPPGTCEKIVAPLIQRVFTERGLPEGAFLLAHSYERVMPGRDYLDSIVNFWRVYSGYTTAAADACAEFLSHVVNVRDYPLMRMKSPIASETAKVLENSYRATTIAFIDEWARFAERTGVDLFEVIDAIRVRPTHSNMRQPGFGVGGYCLTKDPYLAALAARDLLGISDVAFPLSLAAAAINQRMPLATLDRLQALLGGKLERKRVLLMGVSYRSDVGDTRYSPSQTFYEAAVQRGAEVVPSDPLVRYWQELDLTIVSEFPRLIEGRAIDAIVFAVAHGEYRSIDFREWLRDRTPVVLDANRVLTPEQLQALKAQGCVVASMGRGE